MESIGPYLLKCVLSSGLLYIYYWVALRNEKFHQYNRFYLLSILMASIAVPFVNLRLYSLRPTIFESPVDLDILSSPSIAKSETATFNWQFIIGLSCVVVTTTMLFILFLKVISLYRIKRRNIVTHMDGYNFIQTDLKQAPFVFLNNLFWKSSISLSEDCGKMIFTHELTHIRQKHTYDQLFSQLVVCFFWINPVYWIIKHELNIVHEFIADSKSVKDGDGATFAAMLLYAHNEGKYLAPVHYFFNSSIKRRLTMITISKNVKHSYLRRLLALPLTFIILSVFSSKLVNGQTDPKTNPGPIHIQSLDWHHSTKPGDSAFVATITIKEKDGALAVLQSTGKFSPCKINHDSDSARKPVATQPAEDRVKKFIVKVIQNPPEKVIFYLNGKETSAENIKKLDPDKVVSINVYPAKDAVKRYGEKARNGAIELFTSTP